jgi:L-threonylcarbamoyladenylate synthase
MTNQLLKLNDQELADALISGKICVIPTDTVYGLACLASNEVVVSRLYGLKQRTNKPGTIIAADIDQLIKLGLKARYLKAVIDYWPNPISIIIPNHELKYIHLGQSGIAVRIPKDEALHSLLKMTGPLLTTSANTPGEKPAETIAEAHKYFGKKVDVYVDGGDLSGRESSTVIRIIDDAVEVLRQGAIRISESGRIEN